MNFTQLKEKVDSTDQKAVLTLKEPVFEDCYFSDKGMKGVVMHFEDRTHEDEVMYKMMINCAAYRKHNMVREVSNYYDVNRTACLTATEAGFYTKEEGIYVMGEDNVEKYFDVEWVEPKEAFEKPNEVIHLPDGTVTHDPVIAAEQWAKTSFKLRDKFQLIIDLHEKGATASLLNEIAEKAITLCPERII